MKIAQINTLDIGGGAANIARSLHNYYLNEGFESFFIVGKKNSEIPAVYELEDYIPTKSFEKIIRGYRYSIRKFEGKLIGAGYVDQTLKQLSHPLHSLNALIGKGFPYSPNLFQFLNNDLLRPDIIHLHNLHGDYFDLMQLPNISHHKPCIITAHDQWLITGGCAHPRQCHSWVKGCINCPGTNFITHIYPDIVKRQWNLKRRIFLDSQIALVTPCNWLMDRLQNSILKPALKITRVIPNGVDLTIFHPSDKSLLRKELNLTNTAFIVLFVGYGIKKNPYKDFHTFLKVFNNLADLYPKLELVFICLGEVGSSIKKNCSRMIFFPVVLNNRIVAKFYQSADLYLHPAIQDTFPTSIIEAMACGTPVIATAVGGIPEQIIHEKTGFLTKSGDIKGIINFVSILLENKSYSQKISTDTIKYVKENFDSKLMGKRYLKLYSELLTYE